MAVNMADYINPDRCISEMFMLKETKPDAVFLFVEGSDDIKLFSRMVYDEVFIGFCNGKKKVCKLMEKVEQTRLKNVVAVVDRDYDGILKSEKLTEGLFYTDGTDMESSILKVDGAIKKFMLEYSDSNRVGTYNNAHVPELLQKVFDICSQVGKVRLANQKYDMGLRFKGVNICDYINEDMEFSFDDYVDAIIDNSDIGSNVASIKSRITGEQSGDYDFWEICRGHDLVKVLQYVFSSDYGCLHFGNISFSDKELSRFIRGAYEEQWFVKSNIYRELSNWQNRKKVQLLKAS